MIPKYIPGFPKKRKEEERRREKKKKKERKSLGQQRITSLWKK